ncbi:MAG: hypothetical protein IJT51_03475 [Bacteroidales bacterium]|nr:hypothetical protein [Bacteroidales bacterium]
MENHIIQFVCSLCGSILGSSGILGLYYFLRKRKALFSETLFWEYKNIAQELANTLQDLLPLSLHPKNYTNEQCEKIDNELAKFFFKYYLILPQAVLEEINCLHACLLDKGGRRLFMVDKKERFPTLRPRKTEEEVDDLIDDVAIVKSEKSLSEMYKKYQKLPRYICIKCQARHVITVLQRYWSIKDLHLWSLQLSKTTLAQRH